MEEEEDDEYLPNAKSVPGRGGGLNWGRKLSMVFGGFVAFLTSTHSRVEDVSLMFVARSRKKWRVVLNM
jgi:hypothetical protein